MSSIDHSHNSHSDLNHALSLVQAWIEAQMAVQELPGLSVGLVDDQDLVWARGFGFENLERGTAATPSTIYRIASISKTFTSTAVLQLRDQGRLGLDDPVRQHLPWFRLGNGHARAPEVTIRHLLTHTSGLPREAAFPYWNDFQFPSLDQLIEALPAQDAPFPPEHRFKYSNLAVALAGEIVANLSDQPYAEYVHRSILEPLGMASTSVHLPGEHRARLATGYGRKLPGQTREVRPFTDSGAMAPAANLSSTAADLARFISLQFRDGPTGGAQVLKGSTLREMHRPHWVFPDWSGGRGLGFVVYRRGERTLAGHGGHVAGYRTQILFDPRSRVGVAVLINASGADPLCFAGHIIDRLAPALEAGRPAPEAAPFDPDWDALTGRFRNAWADVQVIRQGERLVLVDPTEENPAGSAYVLEPAGPGVFRMVGDDGSGAVGELARFELDPQGRVERLKIGENYTWPVDDWQSPSPGSC